MSQRKVLKLNLESYRTEHETKARIHRDKQDGFAQSCQIPFRCAGNIQGYEWTEIRLPLVVNRTND